MNGAYKLVVSITSSRDRLENVAAQTDADRCPLSTVSTDPDTQMIIAKYGPDEIFVLLEGKTLQGFLPVLMCTQGSQKTITYANATSGTLCDVTCTAAGHHGNITLEGHSSHRYQKHFTVTHGGAYHLKVVRLRRNYAALNESSDQPHPAIDYEYLVSDWIHLNRTWSVETQRVVASSGGIGAAATDAQWVEDTSDAVTRPFPQGMSRFENIESASRVEPVLLSAPDRGLNFTVYVGADEADKITDEGCANRMTAYRWESFPWAKHPVVNKPRTAGAILRNTSLVLVGDSHMRVLANLFLYWACDYHFPDSISFDHVTVDDPTSACAGLQVRYIPHYYCGCKQPYACYPNSTNVLPLQRLFDEVERSHSQPAGTRSVPLLILNCGKIDCLVWGRLTTTCFWAYLSSI
jgi:hypothetical protein